MPEWKRIGARKFRLYNIRVISGIQYRTIFVYELFYSIINTIEMDSFQKHPLQVLNLSYVQNT